MNFDLKNIIYLSFFFYLAAGFSSCVDLEFDEPPSTGTPLDKEANTTISELKSLFVPGKLTRIEDDIIIRGVVVADDRSGNFYRSFAFQDETAGIEVLINLTDYYNFYPIGRELAIDCQGLVLGEYNGIIQLGGYTYIEGGSEQLGDIVDYNQRISRGMLIGTPEPAVRSINSLGTQDISTLVKLEDVEFAFSEVGLTFADAFGQQTLNRTIQDCDGNTIVLRSSGFSTFANETVPEGNGAIVAVFNVFGATKQLFIRELSDIQMNGQRCNGGTGQEELVTIAEVRDVFNNGGTEGPADKKIRGVVISDKDNGNIDIRNLVIQDATAGIIVRFQSPHNFSLGEEVDVVVSGQELSEFNGLLQVNGLSNELAKSNGAGTLPVPRAATVQELLANLESWESTLVQISDATITGAATFNGSTTVNDGTASIVMFTRSGASFSGSPLPVGAVTLTAIVSQFNDPQLTMRNLGDVSGGGMGGDPQLITLAAVRGLFEGGSGAAPAAKKVRGVVISDKDALNWTERNLVLQDESGGIVIRFTDNHIFALGEEIEINISGQELSEFNGLLQVNNVPNANAISFGPGALPAARAATIQEIVDNSEAWESTLVKISNVSIAEGGTYSGAKTLDDGTGTIVSFTRTQATFATENVPAGPFTLTAVVSQFNDPQLTIRNLNDIEQ
ncbi:MAG: hypothetical protein H6573_19705 [Lewinellaceae bacterium]|nr:hypothetical protein [Phaeodactylibacter sp.]MCB0613558.1 hypothetical protein [Phaeodactylibacter sp.]MCB9349713.1 hypothetical protein [Lewinellaceae bacterium]